MALKYYFYVVSGEARSVSRADMDVGQSEAWDAKTKQWKFNPAVYGHLAGFSDYAHNFEEVSECQAMEWIRNQTDL